ncbi:MAG TPA: hypothetical protein VE968_02810 [Sphingomicrobium sp.]|nr:hypothetical protein [Sphingomicrobium sp.]
MIILLAASAIYMSGVQAAIAAPTDAFRGCLRDAASKAKSEKVTGDGIEAYLKKSCTAQMGTLTDALVAFRMKNGMTRKAAAADAAMTVDDYVSTPADNYKFMTNMEAKQAPAAAAAPAAPSGPAPAKAVVTPAAAPTQPPKS